MTGPDGDGRMVKTIEPQAFDLELRDSGGFFLVAFLKRNDRYRSQSKMIDDASREHGDALRCYLFDADYLDTAMQRFQVKGTPTYLLFSQGREVDRLIGEPDRETLDEFIRNSIPD